MLQVSGREVGLNRLYDEDIMIVGLAVVWLYQSPKLPPVGFRQLIR